MAKGKSVKVSGAQGADKQLVEAGKAAGRADAAEAKKRQQARAGEEALNQTTEEQHTHLATPAEEAAEKKDDLARAKGKEPEELTPRDERAKIQAQFDKADEEGKAEMIAETKARSAATGGL